MLNKRKKKNLCILHVLDFSRYSSVLKRYFWTDGITKNSKKGNNFQTDKML